jgi:hypothetical protein
MSAAPPPVPSTIVEASVPRPSEPLGPVALVLALVAGVLVLLNATVGLALQITAPGSALGVRLGFGVPVLLLGAVAAVLGLVAIRRPGARAAIAGAGAGLGGFLAIGQVVSLVILGISAAASSFAFVG